jgi:signal transduction histidine kinase
VLVRRFRWFSENPVFTYLRSSADILVVTLLIHFTGGVESPFKLLYLLELAAISVFGFELIAYCLAGQAAVLYLISCWLETYGFVRHYRLITMPGTLYLSPNYAGAKALALFFTLILMVYISSYLAERLREKQRQIEALSKSQLDFMNTVMHETKSPLTSVLGYLDLLMNQSMGAVNEKQKDTMVVIKRQAQRILALANDLLSLARLESGFTKIDKKAKNLAEVINQVLEELQPQLNERNIALIQELDPKTPPVLLDEDKITEVLINLLSSALKFSHNNGRIVISAAPIDREVMVAVLDEGIGIEPGDLQHIFEKFYRASKESAERKGTGLGLALSRTIIAAHGGRLWAVSAGRGQGAVFYFTLPL